jgi:predicted site-specific integrase-resolvase
MKTYSISGVSRLLGIDPKTLRRWIRKKVIPVPKPGIVEGRLSMCWSEIDIVKIGKYKNAGYWGKGINRKTGKKAKAR